MTNYIGIDLGGTTVKTGLFSMDGCLLNHTEIPTRSSLGRETIWKDIADSVRSLAAIENADLSSCRIGMGMPGPIETDGFLEAAVNLNMYNLYPGKELSVFLDGMPVKVANDANAAALGEMWKGGAQGYKNLILITLGTGVGSGVIIDGSVVYGAHGLGGEIGHIWVNPDEPELCKCGGRGCLDQMASATGIVRNAHRFLAKSSQDSILRNRENLTAKDVIDAAKDGDEIAVEVVDYCMRFLGKAIADITYVIDPEVVVIGGGISKAGTYILDLIFEHYRNFPMIKKCRTHFELAKLGGDAGMYGAAYLAKQADSVAS